MGKTLYKRRKAEELRKIYEEDENSVLTIPLHDKTVNIDEVMKILLDVTLPPGEEFPRIFHIDLSHKVCICSVFNTMMISVMICFVYKIRPWS